MNIEVFTKSTGMGRPSFATIGLTSPPLMTVQMLMQCTPHQHSVLKMNLHQRASTLCARRSHLISKPGQIQLNKWVCQRKHATNPAQMRLQHWPELVVQLHLEEVGLLHPAQEVDEEVDLLQPAQEVELDLLQLPQEVELLPVEEGEVHLLQLALEANLL